MREVIDHLQKELKEQSKHGFGEGRWNIQTIAENKLKVTIYAGKIHQFIISKIVKD